MNALSDGTPRMLSRLIVAVAESSVLYYGLLDISFFLRAASVVSRVARRHVGHACL